MLAVSYLLPPASNLTALSGSSFSLLSILKDRSSPLLWGLCYLFPCYVSSCSTDVLEFLISKGTIFA